MIYVWIALGLVALLVVIPVVIGCFLPERYEGQIQVLLPRSPQEVWDALNEIEKHPMTGKMMRSVEQIPDNDGMPAWIEDMGRGEKITVHTVEFQPPVKMVRKMSAAAVPMSSTWQYDLQPKDNCCRVAVDGETFIRSGKWIVPIFRFMMFVGGGVRKGLEIQMKMVATTLGVEPSFEK